MAEGFLSALSRRAEEAREAAEGYGHAAARRLRHRREDTRGDLRRLWSQLEELVERRIAPRASDYARHAGRAARDYAQEGREWALDAAHHLRGSRWARPLLAVSVAVAAAWLVTSLVSRRRR